MPTGERIVARLRAAGCVFAEAEADVLVDAASGDEERMQAMLERRIGGEPLEHVVGWAEFFDLRVRVAPGVFVPRPRTEALVAHALHLLRAASPRPAAPVIVDACCGSGAIGLALATALPACDVHATDIDARAVVCARENLDPIGATVYEGDLLAPLPTALRGRVAIVAANVPYVPTDHLALLPREARDHEPRTTLDGGLDGLDVARRVLAQAAEWLAPGGHVLVEVTPAQAELLLQSAAEHGLRAHVHMDDDLDATIVAATAGASGWRAPTAGRPLEP